MWGRWGGTHATVPLRNYTCEDNGEPEWEDEHGGVDNVEGDDAGLMPQAY